MAQSPAGTADPARIRHYIGIVAFCSHECAETRAGPHDTFLWNARRLSEALLYALAEGSEFAAQVKPLQGRPMDHAELIRKLVSQGRVPGQLSGYFDILRNCGNVGAHTSGPDTVADTATLDACRRAVIAVVRWFYYDSALAEPMPAAVSDALRDLETEQARTPRPHRTEMELRRLRREVEHLKAQLSPELSMLGTDGAERPGPQRRRAARLRLAVLLAVLALGTTLGWMAGVWSSFDDSADSRSPPSPTASARADGAAAPVPAEPAPSAQAAPADPPAALPSAASPEAPAVGAPEPGAAEVGAAEAIATAEPATADQQAGPALAPEAGKAESPDSGSDGASKQKGCPNSALAVAGRKLALAQGPNPRPNWPQPAPAPPAATLAAFCIDRDPVSAGAFAVWLQSRTEEERSAHLRRKGNAALAGAEHLPANRLTWAEANHYCTDQGGQLPSALQWEAALRQRPPPRVVADTGEWSLDAFPPEAFGYPAGRRSAEHLYFKEHLGGKASSRKPLLSWQRGTPVRKGASSISFRCAYPL